jgi:HlyD family secretion protein
LQEGPTAEAVRTARARVTQAEVALADAAAALAEAAVRAPFAGVVTAVYVSPGEWAGGVVADVMAQDSLEVVLTVDEADVGALAPGQEAIVTLETWPDETIDSEVVSIAPAARAEDSALVSYELHLSLAATGLPVRAGMTASAQLLTAQRRGVLLVPNQAIIADREAGRYYVNLISGAGEEERVERVEVTIGLRDGENTQIVSGLAAGDRLQVGNNLPVIVPGDGGGPFSGQ